MILIMKYKDITILSENFGYKISSPHCPKREWTAEEPLNIDPEEEGWEIYSEYINFLQEILEDKYIFKLYSQSSEELKVKIKTSIIFWMNNLSIGGVSLLIKRNKPSDGDKIIGIWGTTSSQLIFKNNCILEILGT